MVIFRHSHKLPDFFMHSHTEYEITYCICGTYDFCYTTAQGVVKTVKIVPKTLIFMPRGIQHGVKNVEYPYERYFISIPAHQAGVWLDAPSLLSPFQAYTLNDDGEKESTPRFLNVSKIEAVIEKTFERIEAVQLQNDADNINMDFHIRCLFCLLFCELRSQYPDFFIMNGASNNTLVARVHNYIDEHYAQQITIQDMAKQHYVHPNYLTHCFTKQIGLSPRKYLTNLRLANARKLLESSDDTIQDIAMQVGFSNVNNFIQSFRARYTITPQSYRKKVSTEISG
jgi:AraC-like DNA-binding protein